MNIETQTIPISKLCPNTGQIEGLPKNPRLIKDERFEQLKQSIERSPEFLNVRELIVYPFETKFVVIGGNQRLKAAKELKIKTLPCKVLDIETPIEKLRELTIMDNNSFGENDNEVLLADWDLQELNDWGALPTWENESEGSDLDYSDKNKEIDVDSFDDKMVLKLEFTQDDYNAVRKELSNKGITAENALYSFLFPNEQPIF